MEYWKIALIIIVFYFITKALNKKEVEKVEKLEPKKDTRIKFVSLGEAVDKYVFIHRISYDEHNEVAKFTLNSQSNKTGVRELNFSSTLIPGNKDFYIFKIESVNGKFYLKSHDGLYFHVKDNIEETHNNDRNVKFETKEKPDRPLILEKDKDTPIGPRYKLNNRKVYFELTKEYIN